MRAKGYFASGLLLAVVAAGAADAQALKLGELSCVPTEANAVVQSTASGIGSGQSVRLYFRWRQEAKLERQQTPFYWVEMEPSTPAAGAVNALSGASANYWAVPPKPEKQNTLVELYSADVDAAGRTIARSELKQVKVTKDCHPQLDARQMGVAANMTVGETDKDQKGKKVYGFLCDGLVTRVNPDGVRRADELCRSCFVAWWMTPLLPLSSGAATAGALTGVIISDKPAPEPSPFHPR
jgi:hypothetical protein